MRIENLVINCTARYPRTCRRTPFEVVVYELNYSSEDKDLMDLLRTKAEELVRGSIQNVAWTKCRTKYVKPLVHR